MRWRTLPVELLLLAFLGVFLVYPLAYVLPGAASDEDFEARLLGLGEGPETLGRVSLLLAKDSPGQLALRLPYSLGTFPSARVAEEAAKPFRDAGADVEVVARRHWTAFYFQQA